MSSDLRRSTILRGINLLLERELALVTGEISPLREKPLNCVLKNSSLSLVKSGYGATKR
jgi:hypothetical protein